MGDVTIAYHVSNAEHRTVLGVCSGPAGGIGWKFYSGTVTMNSSYSTGGDGFDLSSLISNLRVMLLENVGGYLFSYDHTNKKILAYEAGADGAALDEVTATTDLSAQGTIPFLAIGN